MANKRVRLPLPLKQKFLLTLFALALVAAYLPVCSWLFSYIADFQYRYDLWWQGIINYSQLPSGYDFPLGYMGLLGLIGLCTFLGMILLVKLMQLYFHALQHKMGMASFAGYLKIRKMGLFSKKGLILGRSKQIHRPLLRDNTAPPMALLAPTRSGKGVGFVIPNMLSWPDSSVSLDMKREIHQLTSGYRQNKLGHKLYKYDPLQEKSAHWNPLDFVRWDTPNQSTDLDNIAITLVPEGGKEPIWARSGQSVFKGLAMLVYELRNEMGWPVSIGQINKLINSPVPQDVDLGVKAQGQEGGNDLKALLDQICGEWYKDKVSNTTREVLQVLDCAKQTRESFIAELRSGLSLWQNPLVDKHTSCSDFSLGDLRREPIDIYLCASPMDVPQLSPLFRIFIDQLLIHNTQELPEQNRELKYKVLLMLDEFPAWGRMENLAKGSGYLAGYGLKMCFVFQAPGQLEHVYGKELADSVLKQCNTRILFGTSEADDAEDISKRLGSSVYKKEVNGEEQEVREALLLPQDVKALGNRYSIIFHDMGSPIMSHKIKYYKERRFKSRLMSHSTENSPRKESEQANPAERHNKEAKSAVSIVETKCKAKWEEATSMKAQQDAEQVPMGAKAMLAAFEDSIYQQTSLAQRYRVGLRDFLREQFKTTRQLLNQYQGVEVEDKCFDLLLDSETKNAIIRFRGDNNIMR